MLRKLKIDPNASKIHNKRGRRNLEPSLDYKEVEVRAIWQKVIGIEFQEEEELKWTWIIQVKVCRKRANHWEIKVGKG